MILDLNVQNLNCWTSRSGVCGCRRRQEHFPAARSETRWYFSDSTGLYRTHRRGRRALGADSGRSRMQPLAPASSHGRKFVENATFDQGLSVNSQDP